jgi:NADH-quinone oxidoreductase subunit A
MQASEQLQLLYVLVFFLVGAGTVGLILTISALVRPRRPSREKLTTYECAEVPVGSGWFRLNLRFYTTALIFIIFDVELIAIMPVALIYRDWISARLGMVAFAEIFIFVGVLLIGLVYVWRKGDLEWFKQIPRDVQREMAIRDRDGFSHAEEAAR